MKKNHLIIVMLLSVLLIFGSILTGCTPTVENENVTTYTVRFHENYDGGNVTKSEVESGKTVTLPGAPTREGYTFKGWFTQYGQDASTEFDASKQITADTTVFAKWERKMGTNSVTFKYRNLRTQDKIVAVNTGAKVAKPENPKFDDNDMYAFNGWYTDAKCTLAFDFDKAVDTDIILYAGWTAQKTTVEFDANYAGAPKPTKTIVNIGAKVTKPADPERAMNEFGGWYTERVGGLAFDFDTEIHAATSLYAHWLRSEYALTFNMNGAKIDPSFDLGGGSLKKGNAQYTVKRGQSAVEIAASLAKVPYEGHDFVGWFNKAVDAETGEPSDAKELDLSAINDDITAYAKWTLKSYSVAFDLNYEGAPAAPETQTVKFGKQATEPQNVTRDSYLLAGWYSDKEFTTQFTFDMAVKSDMTLYARWVKDESHAPVKVTYYVGDKVHETKEVNYLSSAATNAPTTPVIDEYKFVGWYEDKELTKEFNMNATLAEDKTAYAKMLKRYTFEAERVDFTGKTGQGTSTNSFEEAMIFGQSFVGDGSGTGVNFVSGGLFVRELYYNGANLVFEIGSNRAIDDAIIVLRVSSECYEFKQTREVNGVKYNYMTDQDFRIFVNPEYDDSGKPSSDSVAYGGLLIPMANLVEKEDLSGKKTPFEDIEIPVKVSLKRGMNTIMLYVDNRNNKGGTYHAEAPMIDCMYIYTTEEANLFMNEYDFYTRPNVQK